MNNEDVINISTLNSEQRKDVKRVVGLLVDGMTRMAAEKEAMNDELSALHKKYSIDKRLIRRMAKTAFNQTFDEQCAVDEEFKDSYSLVMGI